MSAARLNIAFFASSPVSSYWNGAATYYRGIVKALSDLGHRITFYEPDAYERQSHRDIPDPEWAKVVVYQPTLDAVQRALEGAAGADLVVKASGVGVFDDVLEREVLALKRPGNLVVFWDVDAPATLERARQVEEILGCKSACGQQAARDGAARAPDHLLRARRPVVRREPGPPQPAILPDHLLRQPR